MAIRLIDRYPNRAGIASANYPHGSVQNKSDPTADDGTPLEQDWANDHEAFFQGLLERAGITPSGTVDTVSTSDYLDALRGSLIADNLSDLQSFPVEYASDGCIMQTAGRSSFGDGGEGHFRWDSSDLSTEVGNDEVTSGEGDGGIYVAPGSDKTGASGAWVRTSYEIVNPAWWGLQYGTTVDQSFILNKIFRAAEDREVNFEGGQAIAIDPSVEPVTIENRVTVRFNGTRIEAIGQAAGVYNFQINSDHVTVDSIDLTMPTYGQSSGVSVEANDVRADKISVELSTADSTLDCNGIFVGSSAAGGTFYNDNYFGELRTHNFSGGVQVKRIRQFEIGRINVTSYRRGLFLESCSNGAVRGGEINTQHPDAVQEAGADGILIQTEEGDKESHNLLFENLVVGDSPEHCYYLSGTIDHSQRDITFRNCVARGSNSDGFKARTVGDHAGQDPNWHVNVVFDNCEVIDVGNGTGNRLGFNLHGCRYSSLISPKVFAEDNTFSCDKGIMIRGSQYITVTDPDVQDVESTSIASTQSGADYTGETAHIFISGGFLRGIGQDAFLIETGTDRDVRSFQIKGIHIESTLRYDINLDISAGGQFIADSCFAEFHTFNNANANLNGDVSGWLFSVSGRSSGVNGIGPSDNGSTFMDARTGEFLVRKSGSWTAV